MKEVRLNDEELNNVRRELATASSTVWWQELSALFIMPVFLGLLGNALITQIYTSPRDTLIIAITVLLLLICTGLQVLFGVSALLKGRPQLTINEASLRTEIAELREAIRRKSDVHQVLRMSFDEYNAQVCNVSGWCDKEFQSLLDQVFAPTRATIDRVMGISSRIYTIEVYLDSSQIKDIFVDIQNLETYVINRPELAATGLELRYFYSTERVNQEDALRLGNSHPAVMAWSNHVSDEYSIEKYPQLYGTTDFPKSNVYFRRVITVPVRMVCTSNDFWGTIVMTTMQTEEISDDAIENLQWLSSLTTNFIAAYNKCQEQRRLYLESERRSKSQRLRREREASQKVKDPSQALSMGDATNLDDDDN